MKVSAIVATCGRESLGATVMSSLWADEVIVVPEVLRGGWGADQRDRGTQSATGDWLCFMDDDDIFAPGAGGVIREAIEGDAPWHVFCMTHQGNRVWREGEPRLKYGNIGTPMIVVPNVPQLPRWMAHNVCEADYFFAEACRKTFGEPTFHEDVIAHLRPHEESATT